VFYCFDLEGLLFTSADSTHHYPLTRISVHWSACLLSLDNNGEGMKRTRGLGVFTTSSWVAGVDVVLSCLLHLAETLHILSFGI
jgi:hypothetical protein